MKEQTPARPTRTAVARVGRLAPPVCDRVPDRVLVPDFVTGAAAAFDLATLEPGRRLAGGSSQPGSILLSP